MTENGRKGCVKVKVQSIMVGDLLFMRENGKMIYTMERVDYIPMDSVLMVNGRTVV